MALRTADDEKSQIADNYEQGLNSSKAAYQGGLSPTELAELDQMEAGLREGELADNRDDVANSEANPRDILNYTGGGKKGLKSTSASGGKLGKLKTAVGKKGPIFGILGSLGIGVLLAAILGPAAIIIALMQNITSNLDSASRAMTQRQQRVIISKVESPDCSDASFKCKKSRVSNSMLRNFSKAGVIPLAANGQAIDTTKRTGYPDKKPASYRLPNGSVIAAAQFGTHLNSDPELKGKLFGSKGLFNGRVSAWKGKFINKVFRTPFGVKSNGGVADGENKKLDPKEKRRGLIDKIASKIPGYKAAGDVSKLVEKMLGGNDGKSGRLATAKAGGVAYIGAYTACLASKVPSLTTAAVAGTQIVRLLPYINEIVLSPGSKLMASGEDAENAATPEDIDVAGSILTEKVLDKDGNMTSAVDSPLLLAAIGVNKNKISPTVYKDYIPGYSVVDWFNNNPAGKTWKDAQKNMAPGCSVIMSPVTMYAWAVVEAAITGTNPFTFLIKMELQGLAAVALAPAIAALITEAAKAMGLEEMLLNGFLSEDLQGIELGHALGASALAFFPAGAMARFVPGVAAGGAQTADANIKEYEAEMRIIDIASLSPFDTSSKYTFMGSMFNSLRTSAITNGGYGSSLGSTLGSILRIPQLSLSPSASADSGGLPSVCNPANASFYDLEAGVTAESPLLNPLGMPCTDLENSLDVDEAISILEGAGMLDMSKEVSDGADIEELVSKGVIKKDTSLYLLANNETGCNDASTGNYLIEAGGCTVLPVEITNKKQADPGLDEEFGNFDDGCLMNGDCEEEDNEDVSSGSQKNTAALASSKTGRFHLANTSGDNRVSLAMYTFLVDVQAGNAVSGEDEDAGSGGSVAGELVGDKAYPLPKGSAPANTYENHGGVDFPTAAETPIFAVADGVVERVSKNCPITQQNGGKGTRCAGDNHGWGNHVKIKHSDSVSTLYAHMLSPSHVLVNEGDRVKAGQQIGGVGSTGSSTGNHLHFEVYENGALLGDVGAFNWLKRYNILPIDQDSLNGGG